MDLGEWGGGEDLREVVKVGTVNRICCMKINKKSVFNLRKKGALAASAEARVPSPTWSLTIT